MKYSEMLEKGFPILQDFPRFVSDNPEIDGWYYIPDKGIFICFQNKKIHNDDGPAYIDHEESLVWYKNNKHHRLDGPAIIQKVTKNYSYYIHDKFYTEEDFWRHPLVVPHKLKQIIDSPYV